MAKIPDPSNGLNVDNPAHVSGHRKMHIPESSRSDQFRAETARRDDLDAPRAELHPRTINGPSGQRGGQR